MNALIADFSKAAALKGNISFNDAFDRLLSRIDFPSEQEAILPENVETTKLAITEFLTDMRWFNSLMGFQELLKEKSGTEAFRADGKVPNFYHEVREFLYVAAKRRDGMLSSKSYSDQYGGLSATSAIIWRHDSWEDHGIHPNSIFGLHEREIHNFMNRYDPTHTDLEISEFGYRMRQEAAIIVENVDHLTHKHPVRDENGEFKRKEGSGKYVKVPRYKDLTLYYNHISESPHFGLIKFEDSVEGMATRFGVGAFNLNDNKNYTLERRQFYGNRALDEEAIATFPFLEKCIKSSDGMLGVLLLCTENTNYYADKNPENARPISIPKRYMPHATKGYRLLSSAWHPITIFLERLENMAAAETNLHTRIHLDKALYPALIPYFPLPHNYKGTPLSPEQQYVPNGA